MSCLWRVWELILVLFCSATPTLTWCEEYKSINIKRGKSCFCPHHECICGVYRYSSSHSLPYHHMEVNSQLNFLAALPIRKDNQCPLNWRLGGSHAFWEKVTSASCWDSNPRSSSLQLTHYIDCYSNSSNGEESVSKSTLYRTCWVC